MERCDIAEYYWQICQGSNNSLFITYNDGVTTSRIVGAGYGVDGFLYIHTYESIYRVDKNRCTHPINVTKVLKARFPEL